MTDALNAVKCPNCGHEIPEWLTLTATLPADTRAIVDEAITELAKEGIDLSGGKRIAMGRVVEALAASYVAGQRRHRAALEETRGT